MNIFIVFLFVAISEAVAQSQLSPPGKPSSPDTPGTPDTPDLPDEPSLPDTPALPDIPALPALYTFTIDAKRVNQRIPSSKPIVDMSDEVQPTQDITYFVSVNSSKPFLISYYLENPAAYFERKWSPLNGCEPFTTGWHGVAEQIVMKGVTPDGKCPIEPGTYSIDQVVTVMVTLTEPPFCGDYKLLVNLETQDKFALGTNWEFTLNDGTCIPPRRG